MEKEVLASVAAEQVAGRLCAARAASGRRREGACAQEPRLPADERVALVAAVTIAE